MNGIKFHYEALAGTEDRIVSRSARNYAAAAGYTHGDALDVFATRADSPCTSRQHSRKCHRRSTALDRHSRQPSKNATLNGREIEWIEANAFDLLKDYSSAGRQYDTIVVDPPAFAKTKKNLETALRGYKELNLRALKMLQPGGILVSCSCSYHVSEAEFLEVVARCRARYAPKYSAAGEARPVEETTQSCLLCPKPAI